MRALLACLGLGLCLPAGLAKAEEAAAAASERFGISVDGSAPLSVESDALEVTKQDGMRRMVFSRNVVVEQDDVRIATDLLEAFYAKGASQPERLLARGNVVVTQGRREVRCQQATYRRAEQILVCQGDAELRDGSDRARGQTIEFDLANETVTVTGGAAVVLQPAAEEDTAHPEAPNG